MALIKCTGCGHVVSDKAIACPHCGASVQREKTISPPKDSSQESINPMSFLYVLIILFAIIMVIVSGM